MEELKVGDIVKVVRDVNDGMEKEDSAKDVGRYFEIEEINNDFHFPYFLKGSKWRRKREELQFIFRSEGKGEYHKTLIDDLNQVIIQKDNEIDHLNAFYPSHIETLEAKIQELKDQLDYADEQLERQANIIDKLEDHAQELHDRLVEEIKGGEIW